MAVATDQDRAFMLETGFALTGDTFAHPDGRSIAAVWVDPSDSRRGTFVSGAYASPPNRVVMWHAANAKYRRTPNGDDLFSVKPVGGPCESPTACYVQAEVLLWS